MNSLRARLLNTIGPVAAEPPAMNVTTASASAPVSPTETMAMIREAMDALGPKPRWAGGGMASIRVEEDPAMPPGWFGLREPGATAPYAGPLPMASFSVFYRGGDVVRLSSAAMAEVGRLHGETGTDHAR